MRTVNFLVLIGVMFLSQINAQCAKKHDEIITYKLKDFKSYKSNIEHYSLLKFIQTIYKSKIKSWYDIGGMKRIESDDFMILPVMNKDGEDSSKPGLYTIASAKNINVKQRVFDISERICCYAYLMYSINVSDERMFVIFSGGERYIRFYKLYSVDDLQKFLSKINEINLLKIAVSRVKCNKELNNCYKL